MDFIPPMWALKTLLLSLLPALFWSFLIVLLLSYFVGDFDE